MMKNYMDKKKYVYIVIAFFVVVLGYLYFKPEKDTLRVVVKNYSEKSDLFDIHVEYPQFPELPKSFNEKIKKTVVEAQTGFKTTSEENEKARRDTKGRVTVPGEYSFSTAWVPDQMNNNMVSFVLRAWYYTGGAHGGESIYTFNYDLKRKKEVVLSELFPNSPDYLSRISQYAMNDLKLSMKQSAGTEPNIDMLQAGTSPKEENFKLYTLNNQGGITFYFSQYQVAPYVYGEQKVEMPLSYLLEKKN